MRLVLASTSPRRMDLLTLLGHPFEVCAPSFVERLDPRRSAEEQVREFALEKAASCADHFPEDLVLGSDTVIALDDEVIGKPRDIADAEAMLRRLMGRTHTVLTGVALLCRRRNIRETAVACVRVVMKRWDDERLAAYLRTRESLGKAGAYSIQGAAGDLIERIDGDFTAAVGLPLRSVASMLETHGMRLVTDIEALYRTRPYPNWSSFAP